jgi:hypothetical protein
MEHFIAVGNRKGRIWTPITRRGPFSVAKHDDPQSEGVDRAGLKRSFPFENARGPTDSPRSLQPPDRARR